MLPNLSKLREEPTGDAGDGSYMRQIEIVERLKDQEHFMVRDRLPNGPPEAKGRAGQWKKTAHSVKGCCGFTGKKDATLWVFDDDETSAMTKYGELVEVNTNKWTQSDWGKCGFILLFLVVGLGSIGIALGVGLMNTPKPQPPSTRIPDPFP